MRKLQSLPLLAVWTIVVGILACAPAPETGPKEIHWDRDVCEHCQMAISDRFHATELRVETDRRVHAFDDLGCALLWLDGTESGHTEIWLRSPDGRDWIDGRSARYEAGRHTPMSYGFGPLAKDADTDRDGSDDLGLTLEDVRTRVRAIEDERRSNR